MTPSATKPSLCSSSQTSGQEDCWDKTEEIDPLTKLLATWLYDIKKKLVAGEMTAPSDQSLCSSSQKSAREVIGQITEWLPLVQMEERLPCLSVSRPPSSTTTTLSTTLPWCPAEVRCVPSSSAGWRTTRSPTCSRSSTSSWAAPRRSSSSPSARWRTGRCPTWASG